MPHLPISLLLFLILFLSPSPSHPQFIRDPAAIYRIICNSAFLTLNQTGTKTATLYHVSLPLNISTISSSTARFRAGSLRRYGATVKEFNIQPGLVVRRHTKRIIVVRYNLGQLSSIYSAKLNSSGLQLISPVVGLLIYNAATHANVDLVMTEKPIAVDFSEIVNGSAGQRPVCAMFALDGTLTLLSLSRDTNVCHVRQQGMFALVVGLAGGGRGGCGWKVVVAGGAAGLFGAFCIGLVVVAVVKVKRRRSEVVEMERRAREDEVLQVSMIGHVRAPTASVARTTPTLED